MSVGIPQVPSGSGKHPIPLVVISANNLSASSSFYSKVFGWSLHPMSAELTAFVTPAGPTVSLRSNVPAGIAGVVPFIGVSDVDSALDQVVAAGGSVERATWRAPMIGKLARFMDASGTIYGLTSAMSPNEMPRMPMPIASNPRPPNGAVCHLEMYAADGISAASFFYELFGWGTLATMPQYMAFDPGAGIAGIFQSHTPAMPAVAYIYAEDVDTTLSKIETAGGEKIGDTIRHAGTACFGYFKDPSGTNMGLIGA